MVARARKQLGARSGSLCAGLQYGLETARASRPSAALLLTVLMRLFLALHQRQLRSKLDVNHHADAAIDLKKCRRFLPGQHSSYDRHIFLAELRRGDVSVQPAANQIVG